MAIIPDRRAISRGSVKITESVNTKKGKYVSVTQSFDCLRIDVEKPENCHIPLIKNAWRQYLGQNIARKELPSLFDANSLDGLSARSAFILFNRIEMTLDNTKNEGKQLDLYLALIAMQKKCERHLHVRACLSPCSKTLEQKIDALLLKYKHLDAKIESQDSSSKKDDLKKKPEQIALTDYSLVPFGNLEASHDKKALLNEMFDGADNSNLKHKESYKEAVSCFLVFINSEETNGYILRDMLIDLVEKSLLLFNKNIVLGSSEYQGIVEVSNYFNLLSLTLVEFNQNVEITWIIQDSFSSMIGKENREVNPIYLRALYNFLLEKLRESS